MGRRTFRNKKKRDEQQPNLIIGAPDSAHENEAERVADGVMQVEASGEGPVQRKSDLKEEGLDMKPHLTSKSTSIQQKSEGETLSMQGLQASLDSSEGGGKSLDAHTNDVMGNAMGTDFSHVKVHTDGNAKEMNQQLNAKAFTHGSNLYFNQGEYNPTSSEGKHLLAHELTHVVQQENNPQPVLQKKDKPAAKTPVKKGTVSDVASYIGNPKLETNAGLQAAINLLHQRYKPHVKVGDLVFKKLDKKDQKSFLGGSLDVIHGKSSWEGGKPVIWLPQDLLDIAMERKGKISATLKIGKEGKVHELIRTIGHEMHHLWREKEKHAGNPIQPVYEKEAAVRMQKVRDNWLRDIKPEKEIFGNRTRDDLGIPQDKKIEKWSDIDKKIRDKIEADATDTDYISGLYQRSAYLVEEIYSKIEEISYVRVQQRHETASKDQPSKAAVSELCRLVYILNNRLNGMAGPKNLITPKLLKDTRTAMLKYLRKRYPHPSLKGKDSYEVIFYLTSLRGPVPPLYQDGKLVSFKPPGSNPP